MSQESREHGHLLVHALQQSSSPALPHEVSKRLVLILPNASLFSPLSSMLLPIFLNEQYRPKMPSGDTSYQGQLVMITTCCFIDLLVRICRVHRNAETFGEDFHVHW